jgi:RNA polymerase sigma-70 factor (ECF subfamily)
MRHDPSTTDPALERRRTGTRVHPRDEPDRATLEAIKAYLDCRSRGIEPPPRLAAAWEAFYGSYAPRIRKFLRRWALSEADRNDCLQEVWHEVVSQLGRFGHDPGRARLSTWLMTLARNKAVDVIRRRSRHPLESLDDSGEAAALDPGPDPSAEYERRRTLARVHRVLAQLSSQVSPMSFQVVYLRWIEGRPTAEVAAALALTPGQVRVRTCRMKRKVSRLLEESMASEALGDDVPEKNGGRPCCS